VHCVQVRSGPLYLQLQFFSSQSSPVGYFATQTKPLPYMCRGFVSAWAESVIQSRFPVHDPQTLHEDLLHWDLSSIDRRSRTLSPHLPLHFPMRCLRGISVSARLCTCCVPASPLSPAPALYQGGMSPRGTWMTYNQRKVCRSSVGTERFLEIDVSMPSATHPSPMSARCYSRGDLPLTKP